MNENNSLVPLSVPSLSPLLASPIRLGGNYSKGRILTDEEIQLLKGLTIADIIRNDKRLSDKIHDEVRNRLIKFTSNEFKKGFFASSFITLYLHKFVVRSLRASKRSPLKGLNTLQMTILELGFSISQIKKGGVFIAKNFHKFGSKYEVLTALNTLVSLGYVQTIDKLRTAHLTGKVPPPSGRITVYYQLTRQGKTALKDYFKAYEKIYNTMFESIFSDDLVTLNNNLKDKEGEI